jgi:hypothetical protein
LTFFLLPEEVEAAGLVEVEEEELLFRMQYQYHRQPVTQYQLVQVELQLSAVLALRVQPQTVAQTRLLLV